MNAFVLVHICLYMWYVCVCITTVQFVKVRLALGISIALYLILQDTVSQLDLKLPNCLDWWSVSIPGSFNLPGLG